MIATLLVLMLVSALLVGFTAVIMGDQRYRGIDRDRNVAFYAAQAGIEKLSADLGNLFFVNLAPTSAQVNALTVDANKPPISGINYLQSDGTTGLLHFVRRRRHRASAGDERHGQVGLVHRTHRAPDQLHAQRGRADDGRQRGAPAEGPPDGRDSGVPVRHVLGRGPELLRRRELQLRRPRAHQRQPVPRRRRPADAVATR